MQYFDTAVFFDTRLWKTEHPRKHFQNFRQSCVLLTDRIRRNSPIIALQHDVEKVRRSHQWLQFGRFRSDLSITRKIDGKFWKRFHGCFVFQSRVSTKTVITLPGCRVSRDHQACFVSWFCSSSLYISTKKNGFNRFYIFLKDMRIFDPWKFYLVTRFSVFFVTRYSLLRYSVQ